MKKINLLRLKFIDRITGLKIYDVLQLFKKHQYLPTEELDNIRQEKLNTLFSIAKRSAIYYAPFDNYNELPILTKKVISENPSHFLSGIYHNKLIKKSTSGSTGTPFVYYTSPDAQSYLWAGLLLSWEVPGYQFGDKVAFIAGSALAKKSIKHEVFYKLMNIDIYPVAIITDESIVRYIELIRRKNTKLIYGYATAINIIADYIIQNNISPIPGLCGIVCTAEMLTEKTRTNIEKAFSVKVFNQYGCNEAGIAAFECEQHQLHLISSRCIYEIDDEGVLLSTDLANEACIFMKYNTGDIVEFCDEVCSCGRSYPVIKNVVGRCDEIIVDRKNKKIHCVYFNFLFKDDKSIRQYQVLFDDRSITIYLQVGSDFSEKNYRYYINSMRDNFDFESYDIKTNEKFYSRSNLKHSFIIDKRKYKLGTD